MIHIIPPISSAGGSHTEYLADLGKLSLSGSDTSDGIAIQPNEQLPDFFTLQPGETEWFKILPICSSPGRYELRIGIQYIYKGVQETLWSSELVTIIEPSQACRWSVDLGPCYWDDDFGTGMKMCYFFQGCSKWNKSTNQWEDSPIFIEQWVRP